MPLTDTRALIGFPSDRDAPARAQIIAKARHIPDPMTLVAAALADPASVALLGRAAELASTAQERQAVIIAAAYLQGDRDQVDALARDHLADHPDDIVVGWIAAHHVH